MHLKEHMQHRVLPCVDMKMETVPRVTAVGSYDVDVVRNGLLCLPLYVSIGYAFTYNVTLTHPVQHPFPPSNTSR